VDTLSQRRQQDIMVQTVEAGGDITLDQPRRAGPIIVDFPQRRMTAASAPEAMGMGAELRLEVGLQGQPEDFLQQLI